MEILVQEEAQTYRVRRPSTGKDEPDNTNTDRGNHTKEAQHLNTSSSPHFGFYKSAVVLLVLLCVLLLTLIIWLGMKTSQAEHSHKEQDQLQSSLKNLRRENSQLQTQCNLFKSKASQSEAQYNTLLKERDELEKSFTSLSKTAKGEQHLQALYDNLAEERDQLQTSFNNLTREMSQLQTQCSFLRNKTSQTEAQYNTLVKERDELLQSLSKYESMMEIKRHAVDVTLDPDTAHPSLILSADGKQVSQGDKRQSVLGNTKRFTSVVALLAKKGFTSGRVYYEVEVKGKTMWSIGIARESINRGGEIFLSPKNGYWTIWLRNESSYAALIGSALSLSLPNKPERVGVFVDYEAGLVSFYDADTWSQIYSFKNVTFGEKVYPYFSPNLNDGGKNSRPLTIVPVVPCNVQQIQ